VVLMLALVGAGFLAAAITPTPQTAVAQDQPAQAREGKQLYDNTCITCHGANLQGVQGQGPSLIGVGEAAVYFQVSTGRMPPGPNEVPQVPRKPPSFNAAQIDQLGAYIQANGGGPTVVRNPDGSVAQSSLLGSAPARGGELFRLNCAACHNFTGKGGALSSGRYAPALAPATEQQIYTAMVSGPENMPRFSDRQLAPKRRPTSLPTSSRPRTHRPGRLRTRRDRTGVGRTVHLDCRDRRPHRCGPVDRSESMRG